MSIGSIFKSGAGVFSGSGAFTLPSLQDININPGLKTVTETAAGQVSPSFIAAMNNEPTISCKCTDIATMITKGIVLVPLSIPSSTVITKLDVYGTNIANLGTIGGSGTHFKTTINKGLVVLKSITLPQNGIASASIEVHAIFDGTHDPFVYTTSVSLPATWTIGELFTLGPNNFNGSTLSGITNAEVDFNVTVKTESSDGDPNPTFVYSATVKPKIVLTCKDASQLSAIGYAGVALSDEFDLFAMGLVNGSSRAALDATSHCKFSITDGLAYVQTGTFNKDTGDAKICIEPVVGGSGIMTLASGVAISS